MLRRRRSNLGVLELNPYWGTSTGCFPANSRGLANRGPTYQATASGLQNLRAEWTDVYGELSSADKDTLTSQADVIQQEITDLQKKAQDNLDEWKRVVNYGKEVGWDLDDEVEGRRFGEHWSAVGANLRMVGMDREEVFTKLDQLMVYSPTPDAAVDLCKLKKKSLDKYQEIIEGITPFHRAISDSVAENLAAADRAMAVVQGLFEAFIAILQQIIAVILKAFSIGFFLVRWAKVHPKIAGGIGLVIGLAILGIILRPYFTIFQAIIPGI
jgi:type IV secretory pathway TrbD component